MLHCPTWQISALCGQVVRGNNVKDEAANAALTAHSVSKEADIRFERMDTLAVKWGGYRAAVAKVRNEARDTQAATMDRNIRSAGCYGSSSSQVGRFCWSLALCLVLCLKPFFEHTGTPSHRERSSWTISVLCTHSSWRRGNWVLLYSVRENCLSVPRLLAAPCICHVTASSRNSLSRLFRVLTSPWSPSAPVRNFVGPISVALAQLTVGCAWRGYVRATVPGMPWDFKLFGCALCPEHHCFWY